MEMTEIDSSSTENATSVASDLQHSKVYGTEDSTSQKNLLEITNTDLPDVTEPGGIDLSNCSLGANLRETTDTGLPHLQDVTEPGGTALPNKSYTALIAERICKTVLFACVLLFAIGALLTPVILYYTDPPSTEIMMPFDFVVDDDCSVDLQIQEEIISYDELINMCQSELNTSVEMFNNCSDTQVPMVAALGTICNLGTRRGGQCCNDDGLAFFCNAVNALCSNDIGSLMLGEQCVQVRDIQCASEWIFAGNLLNVSLPDCNDFGDVANITFSSAATLTCPDHFGVFCGSFCLPVCSEVSPYTDAVTIVYRVWSILSFVIFVSGGVVTFIASYVKRETMFQYPLVFLVYETVAIQVVGVFLVLPYIFGTDTLMCSHQNFVEAMNEPTVFCQMQGLFIFAGIETFVLFWLFHIVHIFGSLAFPFKAQRLHNSKRFKRRAYAVEMIVILTCGLSPNVVMLVVDGYRYTGFPLLCVAANETLFANTFLIPNTLATMIGVCLLLVSFWIIHKNSIADGKDSQYQKPVFSIRKLLPSHSVAEIKLLIVFWYYLITTVILSISISLQLRNLDSVLGNFNALIICALGGVAAECESIGGELQETSSADLILFWIGSTLLTFIGWVNLFFVIQLSDVKVVCNKLFKHNVDS